MQSETKLRIGDVIEISGRRSARFPSQIGRQAQRMEAGYGLAV